MIQEPVRSTKVDLKGGYVKLPETHEEFMEMMAGGAISNEDLLEIARAHTHRDHECEVCSIEEDEDDWPLFEVIFRSHKESISTEVLEYLEQNLSAQWDSGPDGGGFYERLVVSLGLHPQSSKRMFDALPSSFDGREMMNSYFDEEPDRQEFESDFKKLTQHPLANDKVVREFLEEVHKASEQVGCSGSVEACDACQTLLEEHWGN